MDICTSGGCGAKISPDVLTGLLKKIPPSAKRKELLIGFDGSDDAAVYALDEQTCLISTTDFFTPMLENPRAFGRIAAANALSDVYAMGGRPILALNLVSFPEEGDIEVLGEILAGGAEKAAEADTILGGGHSIYGKDTKYGLAVTGLAERSKILRNNTPRVGDLLILTKNLGVGICMAAGRNGLLDDNGLSPIVAGMERLNRYAAEKLPPYEVSACTDVTGFGLLGHLLEMAGKEQGVSVQLDVNALPIFPDVLRFVEEGMVTAGGGRNRKAVSRYLDVNQLPSGVQEVLFDPQTSGGLLISIDAYRAEELLKEIQADDPAARCIGKILPRGQEIVRFI